MSSSIEDEIVSMKFDNRQFEAGVSESIATLDRLKDSLKFDGVSSTVGNLEQQISGFDVSSIADNVDSISSKFSAFGAIGFTVLQNLTNGALNFGKKILGSVLDPIISGGNQRALNIQQAEFQFKGLGINVEKAMASALSAVKGTAYGLDEAAKVASQFGAGGIKAGKQMTGALRGVAGVAALTGGSFTDIGQIFTTVAGQGRLMGDQLNQFASRGINIAAPLAKQLHVSQAELRSMVTSGQIDFKTFADAMDSAFGKHAQDADQTFTGAMANVHAAMSRIGADFATPRYEALRKIFNALTPAIDNVHAALEPVIKAWTKWTTVGSKAVVAVLTPLGKAKNPFLSITKGIKELGLIMWDIRRVVTDLGKAFSAAFSNVFKGSSPSKAFNTLAHAIHTVFSFMRQLTDNTKLFQGIFTGVLAVLDIAWQVISGVAFGIKQIAKGFAQSKGSTGAFVLSIGNLIASFDNFLKRGKFFKIFFGTIGKGIGEAVKVVISITKGLAPLLDLLQPLTDLFKELGDSIGNFADQGKSIGDGLVGGLLEGLSPESIQSAVTAWALSIVDYIKAALGIHSPATTMIPVGYNIAAGIGQGLATGIHFIIDAIILMMKYVGKAIKELAANLDFSDVVAIINASFFIAFYVAAKKFFDNLSSITNTFAGLGSSIKEPLHQLTKNLKTMQTEVKAKIIKDIAISIGILAVSALILSRINGKKLGVSLSAIAGMMATMFAAMALLGSGGSKGKHAKRPTAAEMAKNTAQIVAISGAMVAFATSVLILTSAVALMGQLKGDTIKKGLGGITAAIAIIVTSTAILSKTGGGATILATAAALLIMSVALIALVGALQIYANLDWQTVVLGGGNAALIIVALGLALKTFSKGALSGSAALLVAAAALLVLAPAVEKIADIRVDHLLKAVFAIELLLGTIAGIATEMDGALPGAAAMLVMAAAILGLATALKIVAGIGLLDLAKAFGALIAMFLLIGAAAVVLIPIEPAIYALGAAMVILGAGLFLAGAGMFLFGSGLALIATAGPAAFGILTAAIDGFTALIPVFLKQIEMILTGLLDIVIKLSPLVAKAFVALAGAVLTALDKLLPKVRHLIQQVINQILILIVNNQVNAAKAMIRFITGMLRAMAKGIPKMIDAGTDLIIGVIKGLSKNAVKIADATGKAILRFLNGIDKAVKKYAPQIRDAGLKLAYDLVDGMTGGLLTYGETQVRNAAEKIASHLPGWMQKVLGIKSPSTVMRDEVGQWAAKGVAEGLDKHAVHVEKSSKDLANKSLNAMKTTFANSKSAANSMIDLKPKITPVLDLSSIEKDSVKIGSHLGKHTIKADVSRSKARDIAADHAAAHSHKKGDKGSGDTYEFVQNITSPEPVNHTKVYRGTKSQIALLKAVTR